MKTFGMIDAENIANLTSLSAPVLGPKNPADKSQHNGEMLTGKQRSILFHSWMYWSCYGTDTF